MSEPTDLLCGHWTFFGGSENDVARCDLPIDHEGHHKFWYAPETGDSFSWSEAGERHHRIEASDA